MQTLFLIKGLFMLREKVVLVTTLAITIIILSACGRSPRVTSEGAKVTFVDTRPSANCVYLGKSQGRASVFSTGSTTSSELMQDAYTNLRNYAGALGANAIYIEPSLDLDSLYQTVPIDYVIEGEIYQCP